MDFTLASIPSRNALDLDRSFLVTVMLAAGFVNAPQIINLGGTSGLGAWTILVSAGAWVLWFVRPYFPRELSRVLLPLVFFTLFATVSLAWGGFSIPAFQNLALLIGFLGFILLSARECERRPEFAAQVHHALDAATLIAALGYLLTITFYGVGKDALVGDRMLFVARSFALFAIIGVARQLARWHAGNRWGLWIAMAVLVLVVLSQSRLSMVATLCLFPLSFVVRGDRRNILRGATMGLVGGISMAAAIILSPQLNERFFGHDASLNVGGVAINGEGRASMWGALLDNLRLRGTYFAGNGAGSASALITDQFGPRITQPHNDFLRFLYEFGVFGLTWWVIFAVLLIVVLCRAIRRASSAGSADLSLHMAPLLGLLAITGSMFTDNSVSYVFVMSPLGILIGCSLSRLRLAGAPSAAVAVHSFRRIENARRRQAAAAARDQALIPVLTAGLDVPDDYDARQPPARALAGPSDGRQPRAALPDPDDTQGDETGSAEARTLRRSSGADLPAALDDRAATPKDAPAGGDPDPIVP